VSNEFKFIFVNELHKIIATLDMSHIRLINFAYFNDSEDTLIVSGVDGTFLFNFNYTGKYNPKLAAQVD